MAGSYAYTPDTWPPLLAALFVAALGGYSCRRGRVPGARPFAVACLFWCLWLVGIAAAAAATSLPSLLAARTFLAPWPLAAATAIFCFVLEYVQPGRWLNRRNLVLLAIPPLVFAAVTVIPGLFNLAWRSFTVDGVASREPGLIGWLVAGYILILALLQLAALAWLFVRSPQQRWPAGLILSTLILTRGLVMWDILQPGPIDGGDSTLLALLLPALIYAIALFGFRIFDPLPTARETVLQQMHSGVIVFDTDWRMVSLNPAAEKILHTRYRAARGLGWHTLVRPGQFLAALADCAAHAGIGTSELPELTTGSGADARTYTPALSPLHDFRGPLIGHLLMLHDVTEQKRTQRHILEQQRALAVLEERERLARELHDGLGQSLAAANLQAGAARLLLREGQTERTDEQLASLAETTLQAQADMREYLLGVQSIVSAEHPFFPTLEQYLRSFTRQYGLPVELIVPPELASPASEGDASQAERQGNQPDPQSGLSQTVGLQLMRIIQEALANTRKHAGAHCAQVIFSVDGAWARVDIVDDGQGFDPATLAAVMPGQGYGLRSMRERAQAVNGSLRVIARPGEGTRVVVRVPLKDQEHGS